MTTFHFLPVSARFWRWTFLLFGMVWAFTASATHNRAGEITYSHVEGLTYEIVITTYTKASALADRPYLFLRWGDESDNNLDSLDRELPVGMLPGDVQVNVYRGTHTYGGPGVYELSVEDPNRNEGVLNMTGSVDTPFAIRSLLIIDPQAGHNNSVQLLNPATENACLFHSWIHNPAAYDPDGDLLTYSLVPCRGFNGDFIPSYQYPDEISPSADVFEVDEFTGDLIWETPQIVGEYNVALKIEEWRMVAGALRKVGEVIRDLQIDVQVCANQPPEIVAMSDTCVLVGSTLTFDVTATDPDGNPVVISAAGGALTEVEHVAELDFVSSGLATFTWTPGCAEIRAQPHQVVFKAQDVGNAVPLVDIETRQITVISPPVEDVAVEPIGYTMALSWSPNACLDEVGLLQDQGAQSLVYRRLQLDETDWEPALCEVGVPEGVGYSLVGVTSADDVGWIDESSLSFGVTYCYRVVTRYGDGAQSLASEEACGRIRKDIPVMTHASVQTTGPSDSVWVAWSSPTELDEVAFPGPYRVDLMGRPMADVASPMEVLWSSLEESSLADVDTGTWVVDIPTDTTAWEFSVRLWSGDEEVGMPPTATTPWLTLVPNDNQLTLNLNQSVPWLVESYVVEKLMGEEFVVMDTLTVPMWVDTGLVNNVTYCYRVTTLTSPLVNTSQTACGAPYDLTPPCPPSLVVQADCELERDTLRWSGPSACPEADDITGYNVYWAPFWGDSLQLWIHVEDPMDTVAVFNEGDVQRSIAGCFVVTALDSLLPGPDGVLRQNESLLGDTVCVDNCPFYALPNVFSPNDDGVNDVFEAFPWKFVDSVDVRIMNRWGEEVFKTKNPAVEWDGTYLDTGELLPDGVYFYTATAFTRRLVGIVPQRLSGSIHLVDGKHVITD
jgi:gliding motility-associated-like protein